MIAKKLKNILKNKKKNSINKINSSQIKMSPLINGLPFRKFEPLADAKKSAVMIILNENDDDFNVLLTVRSTRLKYHSGQISFPGGRIEINETPRDAALRETFEEIGVDKNNLEIIGDLSALYVPPSNSLIYPFVSILKYRNFCINNDEVEELFEVPLSFLIDENNLAIENRIIDGVNLSIPCWDCNKNEKLWGATAMILSEFIDLYKIAIEQNDD